jgi:hypothetical protein
MRPHHTTQYHCVVWCKQGVLLESELLCMPRQDWLNLPGFSMIIPSLSESCVCLMLYEQPLALMAQSPRTLQARRALQPVTCAGLDRTRRDQVKAARAGHDLHISEAVPPVFSVQSG